MTSDRERERRLAEARQRPVIHPTLTPEEKEAFNSLTTHTCLYLNRLYRRVDVQAAGDVVRGELLAEVLRMNELDKAGLLADDWWNRHEPLGGGEPPAEPEPEPAPGVKDFSPLEQPEPAPDPESSRAPVHEAEPPIMGPLGKPPPTPRVIDFLGRRHRR